MSCNSAIYVANANPSVLTDGAIIPLGSIVRRFGNAIQLTGNSVRIGAVGYYSVAANIDVQGAAVGDLSVALYRNGVPIPGAIATDHTGTAGNSANLTINALVRRTCQCGEPEELTLVLNDAGTVTNVGMVVVKV